MISTGAKIAPVSYCYSRERSSPLARGVPAGGGVANNKMEIIDTPVGFTHHPSDQRGIFTTQNLKNFVGDIQRGTVRRHTAETRYLVVQDKTV